MEKQLICKNELKKINVLLNKGQLKKVTIDSISSVSERYEYLPEFSQFQTLIVVIVSSINIVRKKLDKKQFYKT